MPFLHWETDRKRHTFANFIDTVTTRHRNDIDDLRRETRAQYSDKRATLEKPARFTKKEIVQNTPSQSSLMGCLAFLKQSFTKENLPESATTHQGDAKPPAKSVPELVESMNLKKLRLEIDEHRRVLAREPDKNDKDENQNKLSQYLSNAAQAISRKPKCMNKQKDNQNRLGQYLIDAARLYEGITNYRDKKLLDKYLHVDPPIHPRRTLVSQLHYPSFTPPLSLFHVFYKFNPERV